MAKMGQQVLSILILTAFCLFYTITIANCKEEEKPKAGLLVLTVATEENDGFRRFMRSVNKYGFTVKVLGVGEKWLGGDMDYAGGGFKVNLLRQAMEKYKDQDDLLVMFTDSYDLVFTGGPSEVVSTFKKFNSKVVFSAEGFCWPDVNLVLQYPEVKANENRYLNSGGFIGYASSIYKVVNKTPIKNTDDDQLYYTHVFLDKKDDWSIRLDNRAEIFQNLHGALDDVLVKFKGSGSYLYNVRTGNQPLVIHGNGPIKVEFNRLANYLGDQWTPTVGCQSCKENKISLANVKVDDYPSVMIAIFLEKPIPFVEDFLEKIHQLNYPKDKINLYIHYLDQYHKGEVAKFLSQYQESYNGVSVHDPDSQLNQWSARNKAVDECVAMACQYYLTLDGEAQLEDENILVKLIQKNRSVIAPMLVRPGKMWSNFWGALGADGFYKRSPDYVDIVQSKKRGLWNIPYISTGILIHGYILPKLQGGYIDGDLDPDMALCKTIREKEIFLFLDNQENYGFLVNSDNFVPSHLHDDMYQMYDNRQIWEKKYLHNDYHKALSPEFVNEQPCPDVYWFPIFSPTFCRHMIEECENFGQWSGGKHEDARLQGGYENVPTVDIHMNQLEFEQHWLTILKDYVAPLNLKVFSGYYTEARAIMNFVVRYKPGEQDRLRPHHDSSTYSLNIALNQVGVDFEGGGTRYERYNCSVTQPRVGHMLMNPGRLTHLHEGLPTTKGIRYIFVCFVDP